MEQVGVERMITRALDRIPQLARSCRTVAPYCLVAVHGVETTKQLFVRPLSCDDQFAREVEAGFELGISDKWGLTRQSGVGRGNGGARRRSFRFFRKRLHEAGR